MTEEVKILRDIIENDVLSLVYECIEDAKNADDLGEVERLTTLYDIILNALRKSDEKKGEPISKRYKFALEQIQNEAGQGADNKELAGIAHDVIWEADKVKGC